MTGAIEQYLLDLISNVYNTVGWPGVVLMMAIESACIPLPSEIIMPLAGWMLIKAHGLGPSYTLLAGIYGAMGCTLGSAIAYWAGALGGRPFLERYGKYLLISRHDLDLADRWFTNHGQATAFFSRLVPVVRTFISLPAGIARMPFRRFLLYTFLGSLPWSWGLAYGGYLMGENWERIREVMRPFDIPIIAVGVALVVWYVIRHVRLLRRESASARALREEPEVTQ